MKSIQVVAAIIVDKNKIFVTQRGYGDFKGKWEFPGGKIEPGETPQEALIREIKEELLTTINIIDYITTIEYDYPQFHLSMQCYLCNIINGDLTLMVHSASAWEDISSLNNIDWLPADRVLSPFIQKRYNY